MPDRRYTLLALRLLVPTLVLLLSAAAAQAVPVRWTLTDVAFGDQTPLTGSFVFDADAGTPCSSGAPVCGLFSDVAIDAGAGGGFNAASFRYTCVTDVPTCHTVGIGPGSVSAPFLTSNAGDQAGLYVLALSFVPATDTPPAGLTDAGGVLGIGGISGQGGGQQATCADAACTGPGAPFRLIVAGTLVGTPIPEPGSLALLLSGLGVTGLLRRPAGRHTSGPRR